MKQMLEEEKIKSNVKDAIGKKVKALVKPNWGCRSRVNELWAELKDGVLNRGGTSDSEDEADDDGTAAAPAAATTATSTSTTNPELKETSKPGASF